jgi:hypothetical protein
VLNAIASAEQLDTGSTVWLLSIIMLACCTVLLACIADCDMCVVVLCIHGNRTRSTWPLTH